MKLTDVKIGTQLAVGFGLMMLVMLASVVKVFIDSADVHAAALAATVESRKMELAQRLAADDQGMVVEISSNISRKTRLGRRRAKRS